MENNYGNFCQYCGSKIIENSKFCINCGKKIVCTNDSDVNIIVTEEKLKNNIEIEYFSLARAKKVLTVTSISFAIFMFIILCGVLYDVLSPFNLIFFLGIIGIVIENSKLNKAEKYYRIIQNSQSILEISKIINPFENSFFKYMIKKTKEVIPEDEKPTKKISFEEENAVEEISFFIENDIFLNISLNAEKKEIVILESEKNYEKESEENCKYKNLLKKKIENNEFNKKKNPIEFLIFAVAIFFITIMLIVIFDKIAEYIYYWDDELQSVIHFILGSTILTLFFYCYVKIEHAVKSYMENIEFDRTPLNIKEKHLKNKLKLQMDLYDTVLEYKDNGIELKELDEILECIKQGECLKLKDVYMLQVKIKNEEHLQNVI